MSIYVCEECDQQKDDDFELSEVFEGKILCPECGEEMQSYEDWLTSQEIPLAVQ